jgi:hypothetical protein
MGVADVSIRRWLSQRPPNERRLQRGDQRRDVLDRHIPHLIGVDSPINVDEDVPSRDDLAPGQ